MQASAPECLKVTIVQAQARLSALPGTIQHITQTHARPVPPVSTAWLAQQAPSLAQLAPTRLGTPQLPPAPRALIGTPAP